MGSSSSPSALTTPGKVQNRLNTIGQQLPLPISNRPMPQLMRQLHMLDVFLDRLARSPHQQQFILGGGLFLFKLTLAGSGHLRPTQDADFVCLLHNDPQTLRGALVDIVTTTAGVSRLVADFVDFDPTAITIQPIMGNAPQGGQRALLPAALGAGQEKVSLDLAFGASLVPGPYLRNVPTILDTTVTIPTWTAPLEVIMAGKVVSFLKHGAGNTRYKDYFDLWSLATTQDFSGDRVQDTLVTAAQKEGIPLDPQAVVLADPGFPLDPTQLQQWQSYLTREGLASRAPTFAESIAVVRVFYAPVVAGAVHSKIWRYVSRQWL